MRGRVDILGDELHGKGWEKPEMMALLWVLIQRGSLRSRIPQREPEELGSLTQGLENPFWIFLGDCRDRSLI